MPPGCKAMDMSADGRRARGNPFGAGPEPRPLPRRNDSAATPAAPAVAPKAAGVVRIGVVKIKDMSGESLPTDNLRLNLMSEFARQQFEAIPLDAEAPQHEVQSEASSKQCDYIVFTSPTQVKDPGTAACRRLQYPRE